MTKSLYLVRGNDADGENQDLFVVAEKGRPDMVTQIWNTWCVNEGWSRDGGDNGQVDRQVFPNNIRVILEDVTGTSYDGLNRGIDWATIPTT